MTSVIVESFRLTNPDESSTDPDAAPYTKYNIEFTFDTDVRVAITIHYFATEEVTPGHIVYVTMNIYIINK